MKDSDPQAAEEGKTRPGRSNEVETNSAIRLCRFPRPRQAVVGHLSEAAAKVPCVFQDPWGLVLPGCQVRAGPWPPALEAHSGVCGHHPRFWHLLKARALGMKEVQGGRDSELPLFSLLAVTVEKLL